LGGQIHVRSEPGRGSVFQVHLPASESGDYTARSEETPERVVWEYGTGPAEILVVDDEVSVLRLFELILSDHHVVTANSGKEALACVEAGRFDVIFCDVMMPEVTGMEFYDWLRGRYPGDENKIVFMTGGPFTPRAREFLASVPNECLEKPFPVGGVRDVVNRYAARRLPR
jgi:two-component system, cell cycle sensor histidine kinase and response regulator CckA